MSVAESVLGMSTITLQLMRSLARRDASVSELMDELALSRNGVLRHLHPLRRTGVVTARKEAAPGAYRPVTIYRLDRSARLDLAWVVFEELVDEGR
jgi:predicted ArsR family transcriptional regulator